MLSFQCQKGNDVKFVIGQKNHDFVHQYLYMNPQRKKKKKTMSINFFIISKQWQVSLNENPPKQSKEHKLMLPLIYQIDVLLQNQFVSKNKTGLNIYNES